MKKITLITKKLNITPVFIGLLVLISATTMLLSGCKENEVNATEEKLIPVKTDKVTMGMIEKTVTYAGYLKPVKEVNVSSKSMGFVDYINFDVGNEVEEGQVLFALDKRTASNNLVILESQMDTQANSLESALKAAELQYNDAKKNLEDMTVLLSEGIISQQQLEDIKIMYDQARLNYETAQESYDLFFNDPNRSSFSAQIDNAKENLQDHEVKSPMSGIVAQRNIEVGELVGTQPAFTIVQLDKVILEINVPEEVVSSIELNQEITVRIKAMNSENFVGKIVEISPSADKRTFTYPIKIEIDNSEDLLKDGMYAEAELVIEKNDGALLVDRNAILLDETQKYLYVVENLQAKRVDIEVGVDNGSKLEVTNGLFEGQEVIIKGQDYLNDGDKIQVVQ